MQRSIAFKKWEEDHLAGTAGCDRSWNKTALDTIKSGSGKLCMNFKNPKWNWMMENQCMEEMEPNPNPKQFVTM